MRNSCLNDQEIAHHAHNNGKGLIKGDVAFFKRKTKSTIIILFNSGRL